jgi:hypothetical protein
MSLTSFFFGSSIMGLLTYAFISVAWPDWGICVPFGAMVAIGEWSIYDGELRPDKRDET